MRTHPTKIVPLVLGAALLAAACDELPTEDTPGGIVVYDAGAGGGPDGGIRQNIPVMTGEIAPVYGFVSPAARAEYYYLGEVQRSGGKVPANEMYFFYDEAGRPLFRMAEDGSRLVGWHPVVDVIPTRAGYSPFWRVVKVRVKGEVDHAAISALRKLPAKKDTCQMDANCPGGTKCIEQRCTKPIQIGAFPLDGLKSKASLDESLLLATPTNVLINCPVVDADAKLLKGISSTDRPFPKVQIWFERLKAFCYLAEGAAEQEVFGSWEQLFCSRPEVSAACDAELRTASGKAALSASCQQELADPARAAAACEQSVLCNGALPLACSEQSWLSQSEKGKRELERAMLRSATAGLAGGALPAAPADAYFVRQELTFGTQSTQTFVLAKRNLVLTGSLPGQAGYTPLVRELSVIVDKDYESKELRSVAEVKAAQKAEEVEVLTVQEGGADKLHNLVVRGTIPACKGDSDCAGSGGVVDPPLKCSVEQGYCSPPFARLGEDCRRDVKECDPKGGPGGTRLACVGLRVREKYFCFHACDADATDTDGDPDRDSRCGSIEKLRCYALRRTDPSRPSGFCVQSCNSRVSDKAELIAQCRPATPKGHCDPARSASCCDPKNPTAGQACCGNGALEYGETCDDGNNKNKDGCNEFCSLSTFDRCAGAAECKGEGQQCKAPGSGSNNTYCLPVSKPEKDEREDDDAYRSVCMEYDWCWPPDERADWLGKKDEEEQP